jgi:hypothetical protein
LILHFKNSKGENWATYSPPQKIAWGELNNRLSLPLEKLEGKKSSNNPMFPFRDLKGENLAITQFSFL